MIYTVSVKSLHHISPSNMNITPREYVTGVMEMSINVEANNIPEALTKAGDLLAMKEEEKENVTT